ncbi:unnamed protein product [Adineta steineri]|uniref:Uncharacterized protein n=1 Tax=Adineta steineri TaxID=433720 RepID=A0A820DWK9_9BILA|nr:unnamed protein product [Adineta steineri]
MRATLECAFFFTCFEDFFNGDESDIDCGGSRCPKCSNAMKCKEDCDCISNICKNGRCASYLSCEDNIKNQNETDIDCGGIKCPRCDNLKNCSDDCDCISGACKNNQHQSATMKTGMNLLHY